MSERHVIDCDAIPDVPSGWTLVEHVKIGQFEWNPQNVYLYLSPKQCRGDDFTGEELWVHLKGKRVLNACVLNYLLKNPQLMPDEWRNKMILFWGTIFRDEHGNIKIPSIHQGTRGEYLRALDAVKWAAMFRE